MNKLNIEKALNHIDEEHLLKSNNKKSTFCNHIEKDIPSIIKDTVDNYDYKINSYRGRLVYEKEYSYPIGTRNEKILRVVVGKNEEVITAFPTKYNYKTTNKLKLNSKS